MNPVFQRAHLVVFERGWLSSNNVLFCGSDPRDTTLVDTGYHSHAAQTVALVQAALGERRLHRIVNTHLHSDHCGGNHALQSVFGCSVDVPRDEAAAVDAWDQLRLSFDATGQHCPRFQRTGQIDAGATLTLGDWPWQVVGAPGHDPASLVLFQPDLRVLISADALWQNGFGVVFPELDGASGFAEVRSTLDRISALNSAWVIPGHGTPFEDVDDALRRAYRRLDGLMADPVRHAHHAAKVLVKFHLMELQQQTLPALLAWMRDTPLLVAIHDRYFAEIDTEDWCQTVLADLCRSGALRIESGTVFDQ